MQFRKQEPKKKKQSKIERPAIGGRDVAASVSRGDAHHPTLSHTMETIIASLSLIRRIVSLQDATEIILSLNFERDFF